MNKVSSSRSILPVAALLALASLASAQSGDAGKGQQDPAKPAAERQAPAPKAVELALPVQGLSKENADKVKSDLEAVTREFYSCDPCHHQSAKPGKCPGCKGELASKKEPLLKRVQVAADKGEIALAAAPGAELRLSALERALKANAVTVNDEKLAIAGSARLIFRDGASAEEATVVQKALEEAKLFQSVRARFDAAAKETVVEVSGGSNTATRSAVARALEKAGSKSRPNDIAWGGNPVAAVEAAGSKG